MSDNKKYYLEKTMTDNEKILEIAENFMIKSANMKKCQECRSEVSRIKAEVCPVCGLSKTKTEQAKAFFRNIAGKGEGND